MAHVASYIALVADAEQGLRDAFELVGSHHAAEAEVLHGCRTLADLSRQNLAALEPVLEAYLRHREDHVGDEPDDFFMEPVTTAREGSMGLVRDLQDLLTRVAFVESGWTVVMQGARATKDEALKAAAEQALQHNEQEGRWLRTQIRTTAPQALVLGR